MRNLVAVNHALAQAHTMQFLFLFPNCPKFLRGIVGMCCFPLVSQAHPNRTISAVADGELQPFPYTVTGKRSI